MQNTKGSFSDLRAVITELAEISATEGGATTRQLIDSAKGYLAGLGFDAEKLFGDAKVSLRSEAKAIVNVIVQANKRLATQETGNGISNSDRDDLKTALGAIDFFGNPQEALRRLAEAEKIFDQPFKVISNYYESMNDRDNFLDENAFNQAQEQLEKNREAIELAMNLNRNKNPQADSGTDGLSTSYDVRSD